MSQETTLNQAWAALRVVLRSDFTFYDIKNIVGLARLDVTRLAPLVQRAGGGASKGQLVTALDREIGPLDHITKRRVLTHNAEEIVARRPDRKRWLNDFLERMGWQFAHGRLIPTELFDVSDLAELPEAARTDLVKAVTRLRDGDLDGSLAAACAAVDSAANAVYAEEFITAQPNDGFQARCTKALEARGTIARLTSELRAIGWEEGDSARLAKSLRGALRQGAYVMQTLHSRMSDVHGSKRVLKPLVSDSVEWAELIVRNAEVGPHLGASGQFMATVLVVALGRRRQCGHA